MKTQRPPKETKGCIYSNVLRDQSLASAFAEICADVRRAVPNPKQLAPTIEAD